MKTNEKRQRAAKRLIDCSLVRYSREMAWLVEHLGELPSEVLPVNVEAIDEAMYGDGSEDNYKEVTQWYAVDFLLAKSLQDHGEVVIYVCDWDTYYWGRTTYGQALCLDWVLQEIAADWFGLDD